MATTVLIIRTRISISIHDCILHVETKLKENSAPDYLRGTPNLSPPLFVSVVRVSSEIGHKSTPGPSPVRNVAEQLKTA